MSSTVFRLPPSFVIVNDRHGATVSHPFIVNSRPTRLIGLATSSRGAVRNEMELEQQRAWILEKYGLDPSDFVDESYSDTSKGRRGRISEEEKERGNRKASQIKEEIRTTHKLLQVLGGKARRRKLLSPKSMDVRPMMEVVRGAAIDILQVAGGCPSSLRPGRWLDLYSGTGSVGIEAMNRGCSEAHFVEMDPWVVSEVLKPNLECTEFSNMSVIHTVQVEKFLEQATQYPGKDGVFDYISVTPPYTAVSYSELMAQLSTSPLVGNDTFILVEYPLRTEMEESCGALVKISDKRIWQFTGLRGHRRNVHPENLQCPSRKLRRWCCGDCAIHSSQLLSNHAVQM